ncbi:MAG: MFS transporter, partial [Chloroflexaceae bacterium]|nr:MFS transporter [Chloroflexaceae bacterium]
GDLGLSFCLLGLAFSDRHLGLTLGFCLVLGGFAALIGVPMQTIIQEKTPVKLRGKVFGLQNNLVNLALSLPLALAGVAETLYGLRPVLLSLSALALLGCFLTWNSWRKAIGLSPRLNSRG